MPLIRWNEMNDYSVIEIQEKVIGVADTLKKEFNLPLNGITFIRCDSVYGRCSNDGTIQLKIEYFDGELVPLMEVWRTLAHEMAHLKHFNHGDDFWRFNKELVLRISEIIGKRIRPEVAILSNRSAVY